MAVRNGMTALIDYVDLLTNNVSNDKFTDQQTQDALDNSRLELRYKPLVAIPTIASGGTITYTIFQTGSESERYFDTDIVFKSSTYATITPSTFDYILGRFTFSSQPSSLPVLLLGFSYDVYQAAIDLLLIRGSKLSEEAQSFSTQNGSFSFNANKGVDALIASYRPKVRFIDYSFMLYRNDVV